MEQFRHGGNVWVGGDPEKWIDFSANLNPKGPPKIIIDHIKENFNKIVYYPDADMKKPSANIAEYLGVETEQILPTNGGIGALSLVAEAYRPNKVIILQPSFVEYMRLAKNVGAKAINIPIINRRGKLYYPLERIIEQLERNTMIFVCNPSNPTGSTIPREKIIQILEESEKHDAKVVVDEAFIEYAEEESLKELVDVYKSLVIAGSLTKIFAIPGIRLGYICSNDDYIMELRSRQVPWTLSSFACDATDALSLVDDYIAESIEENIIQREYLKTELEKLGIDILPSKSNFLLLNFRKINVKVYHLQNRLYDYNILIRDCSNYIFLDEYYARIAVKSNDDNKFLMRTLKEIL